MQIHISSNRHWRFTVSVLPPTRLQECWGYRYATCHFLCQCWPRFMSPYGVIMPPCVKQKIPHPHPIPHHPPPSSPPTTTTHHNPPPPPTPTTHTTTTTPPPPPTPHQHHHLTTTAIPNPPSPPPPPPPQPHHLTTTAIPTPHHRTPPPTIPPPIQPTHPHSTPTPSIKWGQVWFTTFYICEWPVGGGYNDIKLEKIYWRYIRSFYWVIGIISCENKARENIWYRVTVYWNKVVDGDWSMYCMF